MSSSELPPNKDLIQAAINLCPTIKAFLAISSDNEDAASLFNDQIINLHERLVQRYKRFDKEILGGLIEQIKEGEVLRDLDEDNFEGVCTLLSSIFMMGYEAGNPEVEKQGGDGISLFVIDSVVEHVMDKLGPEEFFVDEYQNEVPEMLLRIAAAGMQFRRNSSRAADYPGVAKQELSQGEILQSLMERIVLN